MANVSKSVFISYRRSDPYVARSVFQHLSEHKYDVFMDVENIDSGTLDIIFNQIQAREHFVLILVPGAFDNINAKGDWLRREIEHAITHKRNIVPIMAKQFDLRSESKKLSGNLADFFNQYNGLVLHNDYFKEGMEKLRNRFFRNAGKVPTKATPPAERKVVQNKIAAASNPLVPAGLFRRPSGMKYFNEWKSILNAPKLEQDYLNDALTWNSIPLASGYVLQKSFATTFSAPVDVYEGSETRFPIAPSLYFLPEFYRVKAKGDLLGLDSPWSNTVKFINLNSLTSFAKKSKKLATPELQLTSGFGMTTLSWTKIAGATGYQLERSKIGGFLLPETIYAGDQTTFVDFSITSFALGRPSPFGQLQYFRVRAKGGKAFADSDWSNIVQCKTRYSSE